MTTETTQQEIILLPELPPVPSRTEDEQATYNTKAFNFRACSTLAELDAAVNDLSIQDLSYAALCQD